MNATAKTSKESRLRRPHDISGAVHEASSLLLDVVPTEIGHLAEAVLGYPRDIASGLMSTGAEAVGLAAFPTRTTPYPT